MDEDINSFLLFCGTKTALANPNLQPGIELYHNRACYRRRLLLVSLAPTTTMKKLLIGFHLLLVTTLWISELATTRSADCFSQNPTIARRMSFIFLLLSSFVTNLSPYKCRGILMWVAEEASAFGAGVDGGKTACCVITDCSQPSCMCVDKINKLILNLFLL
jgi:hypothetical protein